MNAAAGNRAKWRESFTPKLVTVLREGYGLNDLRRDAIAGLTVAIVALPLSMAIAIASGVGPDRGLYAAIVGGFLVSALGGSRFQIGGPAGAFIVLVAATVHTYGVDGMILATIMSGVILAAVGFLRLGGFIRFIPYPVTVGFTAGIAAIIFVSQLKDLLGLPLAGPDPDSFLLRIVGIARAIPSASPAAVLTSAAAVGLILLLRRYRPDWPGFLIAVVLAAIATAVFDLPVETLGSRFCGIPYSLPAPSLPAISIARLIELLPTALAFALLGGIESLLSAVVADGMTGRRHRSDCELVAQGAANVASGLFGGICVTGTIARTATNVRAGARGPVSGMLHSLFLLAFLMLAAPLARFIPLAALAAVLVVVAWNMAEKHEFAALFRASRGDAVVLMATFLLVLFRDLIEGILAGFCLSMLLRLHRMTQSLDVREHSGLPDGEGIDEQGETPFDAIRADNPDIAIYRISGAFFFGTASAVGTALDRIGQQPRAHVIDMADVAMLDSTAAATLLSFARRATARGAEVIIAGARAPVRRTLLAQGARGAGIRFRSDIADAVSAARQPA